MAREIIIPQHILMEILKFQPESVLIELFDNLFINSDDSPLTDEEKVDIEKAKEEYLKGETVVWQR